MKYIGKLYGKVGGKTFDTGKTSQDWYDMEDKVIRLSFFNAAKQTELELCQEIFNLTLKYLKSENNNAMPIEHIEHRLRSINLLLNQ